MSSPVHRLNLKPHACSHCDATFTQAGNLKTHLSAVHLGLKPFACSHCEAAFASVGHLKTHLSSVHLGLKPYECEWCVAAYTSPTEAEGAHGVGAPRNQ